MNLAKKVFYLLIAMTAIFYLPYIAVCIRSGKIPDGFFHFPALVATPKPGLNAVVIVITALLFLLFLLLLFVPSIFGFKKVAASPAKPVQKLPRWFWIGLALWLVVLAAFAAKITGPKWLTDWALLPLWWGFIYMLDGIVYARNNGKSLVNDAPTELFAMGVMSISGWLIFEYFNFFIKVNWYYPAAKVLHHDEFLLYAVLGSSAFIPMGFEWYHLLRTFPHFNRRFKAGPKVRASKKLKIGLLIVGFAMMFGLGFRPDELFYAVWLAPLTILIVVMSMLDIWTPFRPIAERGDWTALLVFAPVWLLQGICVEAWNYLSYDHASGSTSNAGYWEYCVPYVDFAHIFNMPLLGYLGYVPFSIYCFMWFIALSFLMKISPEFSFSEDFK